MSLHYLIDGYNLLYALPDMPAGSWQDKRAALIQRLNRDKPFGRNQATIVFDSREGLGNRETADRIEVIFTAGETADDWISRSVRELPNPRTLIVVSDDQGLRRMVRGTGAKSLSCREFLRQGRRAASRSEESPAPDAAITEELKKKWL